MIDIETLPTRTACKNGTELDAIEHARDLTWRTSERSKIKRSMNRRGRRQTRQALRSVRS
jgi:hypothetical protein